MHFSDFELPVTTRDQRMLCSGCNMFGSVEDLPWTFNGMTGTAGGMTKIDDKWYHRPDCSARARAAIQMKQNVAIEQEKKKAPVIRLVPREERRQQTLLVSGKERRSA